MGPAVLVLLSMLAAAVPDLVPRALGISAHPPDLFAALAAYLALRADGYRAVPWALALGAAQDSLSLDPLGSHAFALGAVAFLLARPRASPGLSGAAQAVAVGAVVLLSHAVYVLRMVPVAREGLGLGALAGGAPVALWSALFSWPLLSLLDRTRALDGLAGRARDLSA